MMRWRGTRQSENVRDLRGRSAGFGARAGGLGIGGVLLLMLLTYLAGGDPLSLLTQIPVESGSNAGGAPAPGEPDEAGAFVGSVLADTETVWQTIFPQQVRTQYVLPILNRFSGRIESACGRASAAIGPFYCPGDSSIYLDTTFFAELDRRFGAPGDFAQAYVIAHEVGHHVQNLLGLTSRVSQMQQRSSEAQSNQLSVRLELQADCFAGVWGHHTQIELEEGDVEEGLRAAAAIGDDRLQSRSQGQVVPESFTHGSSEQRVEWLTRGLKSGRMDTCDTFGGS
jgi:predicted metalloprotease